MDYELVKQLKETGFPQIKKPGTRFYSTGSELEFITGTINGSEIEVPMEDSEVKVPTLEELIEACGDSIRLQSYYSENDLEWQADTCAHFTEWDNERHHSEIGKTPSEAVARLWLELNKK